jgi:putative oxidoreductase
MSRCGQTVQQGALSSLVSCEFNDINRGVQVTCIIDGYLEAHPGGGSYGRFQRRNDEKAENEASVMENDINDGVILAARLLLATLFLIFGWRKLTDYSGTVSRMVQDGARIPVLATAVAIFMELPVAFAVAVGAFTRPSAVLLVLYTLGAALIAHHYWTMTGANKIDSMESFYKNSVLWEAFCCFTSQVRENIRSMPYWDCKRSVLSGQTSN